MNDLLWKAIHKVAGMGSSTSGDTRKRELEASSSRRVRVSLNPTEKQREDLFRRGFGHARTYLALPSVTSPRWLFPLENGHSPWAGLRVYGPCTCRARVMKTLLAALVASRCQAFLPHRLLVASPGSLAVEDLVREVTGDEDPVFALSLSTEKHFRKLTMQVMCPNGEVRGYIKLPLTDAAGERVRQEAETLTRLASFPALLPHVPRVLYAGDWGGSPILFQSPGPSHRGPSHLDRQCAEFLQLLWRTHPVCKPGLTVWEEVATVWHKVGRTLDLHWWTLGERALATARRELGKAELPCGIVHGDFAPWNLRSGDDGLYVFDWESARWEAPVLWDIFHFVTQAAAHLKRNHVPMSWGRWSGDRASFLLYLLSSACQLATEDSPMRSAGLECRRQLLLRQLEGH